MDFYAIPGNFVESAAEALAVAVFKDEKPTSGLLKELDNASGGQVAAVIKSGEFKGDSGETALLRLSPKGKMKASRLLLVGIGDKKEFKPYDIGVAAGTATRALRKANAKSIAFSSRITGSAVEAAQCCAQGAITSQFELDKYKTKDKNDKAVTKFGFHSEGANAADVKRGLSRGDAIGESMNFTRDLANEPPNILTPTEMANRAQKMAKEVGLKY
ncbi:MAG TPA: M17 family peptidase N-terminal domain-containing protein, partial [Pyrinomonadaceae bacterium]|nr:M17 family peptidase N-terminal domain-containing protein [Pyrinomonadaceae bacterium]